MKRIVFGAFVAACGILFDASAATAAPIVLDFEEIASNDVPFFTPYENLGFTITNINPPTAFSAGFESHGPSSPFFAGSRSLIAFAPATLPANEITLTRNGGMAFSVTSIDLARNFAFDPAPTVTFTGTKSGGGTVTQSFTVTTPLGTAAFQTFAFTGFTDLVSLEWGQPPLASGLHQFDNIRLDAETTQVPEPATAFLLGLGVCIRVLHRSRRPTGSQV